MEAVAKYVSKKKQAKQLDLELGKLKKELAELEPLVLDYMNENALEKMSHAGMTVYTERKLWASAINVDCLAGSPHTSGLVRPTCNSGSLSSWVRELEVDEEGMPIVPIEVRDAINVTEKISVRTRSS